ncbi:MAG: hypothetical protein QXJ64_07795 [Thermosphaera sp.]
MSKPPGNIRLHNSAINTGRGYAPVVARQGEHGMMDIVAGGEPSFNR